jgi:hypothetical protein
MDTNFLNMVLVLGGSLIGGFGLLYWSLKPGLPHQSARRARAEAAATTAAMIATNGDRDAP